jgi:nitrate/TMAO reductase-like tetraheme cytochrome c subunit
LILVGLSLLSAGPLLAQQRTRSPHGDLKVECRTCHRPESWTQIRISREFNHGKFGFPLAGAHASSACRACHESLDFKGASRDCASCHTDVHRGELGADCARCHTPRAFQDREAMVRSHQTSRFPLEGAHRALDCSECHAPAGQGRLQFVARSTSCVSCHAQQFASAKDPDHVAGGFPHDCGACHAATIWHRARFNHELTSFPLVGAHRAVECMDCHTGGRYRGTQRTCIGCHQADFDRTQAPAHGPAGFSTDCLTCHGMSTWAGVGFDHTSRTRFPLTGAHRAVTCTQCHGDGVYAGKPTDCVACHQTDYTNAANPRHTSPGFGTTCTSCHTTVAWSPATFDHNATQFPLTGAHRAATCADCHADGVYDGKPTTCVPCHQTDYDATTNPRHTLAVFPLTCNTCHTTTRWTGATINHTWFKTPHHGVSACSDCHVNANDFRVFECILCHEHNRTDMDNKHRNRSGYTYTSSACYQCHQND